MKTLFIAFLVLGAGAFSFAQSSKDADIVRVANAFFNSWNKHDFSDMASYTTDDVSVVINVGVLWKGRSVVQASHENAHKTVMKNTSFTPDPSTVSSRLVTPDVAVVNMVAKMDAFYPPDGVDHGNNKAGDNRVMITIVEVKKNGKWLVTAIQGTDINPMAEASLQHQ